VRPALIAMLVGNLLLERYPITGWSLDGLDYTHPDLNENEFWNIVQCHQRPEG
jgi:hypothetical protein